MVFPMNFGLLFAAAMLISSIGFKNYVWFISLGYGFSIAGEGLLMMLLYGQELTLGTTICCILFIIYGCRLGGYLAYREFTSNSYKKNMTVVELKKKIGKI
jgi:steroid 5-alpha reductase family enzyme